MFKKVIFPLIAVFYIQTMSAQKEANIWYFGTNAGLDFNSGAPVALTDGVLNSVEPSAAIADASGQLLFYTDGITVWNKNHQPMPNGLWLFGHTSSTQGATIVPKPGSSNLYYVFTVAGQAEFLGVRYSVVDMNLNNGMGDVTSQKNVAVHTPSPEKLTVTNHSNGVDYWIITHGYDNDTFFAHLLSAAGLSDSPVVSNVGIVISDDGFGVNNNFAGAMKISPDGSRLAAAHTALTGTLELFDFDTSTGVVSNPQVLLTIVGDTGASLYGVEFSPDGKVLYASSGSFGRVYQFDLEAANIPASALILHENNGVQAGALQLGPDGKIYLALYQQPKLGVINFPGITGTGCGLEIQAVDLGGKIVNYGLPNFVQSFFRQTLTLDADSICLGEVFMPLLNPASDVLTAEWNFGDGTIISGTNPAHLYSAAGTYTLSVNVTTARGPGIVSGQVTVYPVPQVTAPPALRKCGEDGETVVFDLRVQDAVLLGTQQATDFTITYHTLPEDAIAGVDPLADELSVAESTTVFARVTNNGTGCYAVTNFMLELLAQPEVDLEPEYVLCGGSPATITAPSGFDGYLWSTGDLTRSIEITEPGSYTLTVFTISGPETCTARAEFIVSVALEPVIREVLIEDWTDSRNSITVVADGGGDFEYSIDGVNFGDSPEFTGLENGVYTVYVRDSSRCSLAMQEVVLLMYPRFFTPNGDGHNETWRIAYGHHEPDMVIHVFDRYGKLLTSFRGGDTGWDGTLNGVQLPSTDYWFVATRHNGREYKGHFSLVR